MRTREEILKELLSTNMPGHRPFSLLEELLLDIRELLQKPPVDDFNEGYYLALKHAVELADLIESQHETEFNEWRAFKGLRNQLRDKMKEVAKP